MEYSLDKEVNVVGIGVDIESLMQFRPILLKYTADELNEVFTSNELGLSEYLFNREVHLALCFSAKESIYKALGKYQKNVEALFQIEISLRGDKSFKTHIYNMHSSEIDRFIFWGAWNLIESSVWTRAICLGRKYD